MSLECGGRPEHPEETHTDHTNCYERTWVRAPLSLRGQTEQGCLNPCPLTPPRRVCLTRGSPKVSPRGE
uniref:Uncharacterized protein n=1 Tax=Scleropages formosus TaxID=113540 RepID=A0A8C9SAJ8_SCLFO